MLSPTNPRDELSDLLDVLASEQVTAQGLERIETLVRSDVELRRYYIQRMRLLSDLEFAGRKALSMPSTIPAAVSPSPLMGKRRGEGAPTKSPVLGFLGGVVDYVSHSRTLMFWLLCGTFGLYFAVQFGSLMVSRFWAQNAAQVAEDRGAETENGGQLVDHPGLGSASGKIVARLTNAVDCQWKVADAGRGHRSDHQSSAYSLQSLDVGTEFYAGQKLNLTAGLAELTFDSGAKVVLTAPAQFDVTDILGGDLQLGRLTAKVPHAAHGFTVATPGGKVVDLGTEFGVKVNEDRTMHVVVYVGEVVVNGQPISGAGTAQLIHVHAGEAIVVSPGQPGRSVVANDERFVRDLTPLLNNKAESEAAYVAFTKSLKPVVWFRMEGKDVDRTLRDEMGGPEAPLFWDGPGNPFVKGPVGKSLWLRGDKLRDCAILADYPKAEHGKLTVSAWAYAVNRANFASIVKNWNGPGQGQFEFGLRPKVEPGDGNDLTIQISDAKGQPVLLREGLTHPFPLNQWQHVAFTTDGSTLRLYRQGREVAAMQHNGLLYPVKIRAAGIGVKTSLAGDAPDRGAAAFWDGKLDEIAVFNEALSAEEIQRLAAASPR